MKRLARDFLLWIAIASATFFVTRGLEGVTRPERSASRVGTSGEMRIDFEQNASGDGNRSYDKLAAAVAAWAAAASQSGAPEPSTPLGAIIDTGPPQMQNAARRAQRSARDFIDNMARSCVNERDRPSSFAGKLEVSVDLLAKGANIALQNARVTADASALPSDVVECVRANLASTRHIVNAAEITDYLPPELHSRESFAIRVLGGPGPW